MEHHIKNIVSVMSVMVKDLYMLRWLNLQGFNQRPRSVYDVSDSGFKTDRINIK